MLSHVLLYASCCNNDVHDARYRAILYVCVLQCGFPVAGSQLGVIDTATSSLTRLSTGYSSYGKLAVLQASEGLTVVTVAGSPSTPQALVKLQVRVSRQAVMRPLKQGMHTAKQHRCTRHCTTCSNCL
jgi:hypothetical protein